MPIFKILRRLVISLFALGLCCHALAGTDNYTGLWAKDKSSCTNAHTLDRLFLQSVALTTPSFECKFLGLRQNDDSGMTFMANCNGEGIKWHDEVTIKALSAKLYWKLKSEGQENTYTRCQ
jgi:hypothetical protein